MLYYLSRVEMVWCTLPRKAGGGESGVPTLEGMVWCTHPRRGGGGESGVPPLERRPFPAHPLQPAHSACSTGSSVLSCSLSNSSSTISRIWGMASASEKLMWGESGVPPWRRVSGVLSPPLERACSLVISGHRMDRAC